MNLLDDLNESQQEAVTHTQGPSLVIAGAGSGKTRVLTYRIAYLLEQGVDAHHILALTFTNKAAREMKERIASLVGERTARYLWMGTFHSFCAKVLRHEAETLHYTRDFTILDAGDSKSLVTEIMKDMEIDTKQYKISTVLNRISMAKNHLMSAEEYAADREIYERDRHANMFRMADIYLTYQQRLRARNSMDFDDLLVNMYELLRGADDVRKKYQEFFEYVLVDEYQDTNLAQYKLLQILAAPQNNICVVGDDAQSIYSFRGAEIANILGFQKQFEDCKLYKLEQNYRSTQTIVNAANSLIQNNRHQIPKTIYSHNASGEKIHVSSHESDREEAAHIASIISSLHRKGYALEDIAVLYRTNAQSRLIEASLRSKNLAYRIYGGVGFYQRKIVKDALAYIRLIVNPLDTDALRRIINIPARGIGNTTIKKIDQAATEHLVSDWEVIGDPKAYGVAVSSRTLGLLTDFVNKVKVWQEDVLQMNAYDFMRKVMRESNLETSLKMDNTADGIEHQQNFEELMSSIRIYQQDMMDNGAESVSIKDFLSEVSLLTDQDEETDDNTDRVTLMTVHAAKGLEFGAIIIAGMEEELFPLGQAKINEKELEEERRLFYVAITRAKNICYITHAQSRWRNGETVVSQRSSFIREIDDQYLDIENERRFSKWGDGNEREARRWGDWGLGNTSRWGNGSEREGRKGDNWTSNSSPFGRGRQSDKGLTTVRQEPVQNMGNKRPLSSSNSARTEIANPKYPIGCRVAHAKFGQGTVKEAYSEGGNELVVIKFDDGAERRMILAYAKLEKLT